MSTKYKDLNVLRSYTNDRIFANIDYRIECASDYGQNKIEIGKDYSRDVIQVYVDAGFKVEEADDCFIISW